MDTDEDLTILNKGSVKKFLSSLAGKNEETDVYLLCSHLEDALSYKINILPTSQSTNLIENLLQKLEKCINDFNEEKVNVCLVQGVSWLVCTILNNCRLFCPSVPTSSFVVFVDLIHQLRCLLSQFGSVILKRTHVRGVMQPFLRLCHVWGDMDTLLEAKAGLNPAAAAAVNGEVSSPDLSSSLPFLTSHQWSAITERISNFGDQLCNTLLMRLLIQKLEKSSCEGLACTEPTAKYVVERFRNTQLPVTSVINPEQLNVILESLGSAPEQANCLITLIFNEVIGNPQDMTRWTENPTLLENRSFVISLFEVSLRALIEKDDNADTHPLARALSAISLQDQLAPEFKYEMKKAMVTDLHVGEKSSVMVDFARKVCRALVSLPLNFLASSWNTPIALVAGTMVYLDFGDPLISIVERLLFYHGDLEMSFDVGLMISWVTTHVEDGGARARVTELLVKKSSISNSAPDIVFTEIQTLVETLGRRRGRNQIDMNPIQRLETLVNLHVSIRKCWKDKKDANSVKYNSILTEERNKLNKLIRSELEILLSSLSSEPPHQTLLDAYNIDLQQRDRDGDVQALVDLHFTTILNTAFKSLKEWRPKGGIAESDEPDGMAKSSLNLLITVLNCVKSLRPASKQQHLVFHIYQQLEGTMCPDLLWQKICHAATPEEMKKIMKLVIQAVKPSLSSPDDLISRNSIIPNDVRWLYVDDRVRKEAYKPWSNHYVSVWMIFMQKAEGDKLKCCCDPVKELLLQADCVIPVSADNPLQEDSLLVWFKFLRFISSHPKIPRNADLEKYLLHAILSTRRNLPCDRYYAAHMDLITVLVSPAQSPALRYPHFIFLVFKKMLAWILANSDDPDCVQSAFLFEKFVVLLSRRKDELRVIFYLQEVIIGIVSKEMAPPVKMHLKNSCFALMSCLEERSYASLQLTLPPGCREVFQSMHKEFGKFYRYKGKI